MTQTLSYVPTPQERLLILIGRRIGTSIRTKLIQQRIEDLRTINQGSRKEEMTSLTHSNITTRMGGENSMGTKWMRAHPTLEYIEKVFDEGEAIHARPYSTEPFYHDGNVCAIFHRYNGSLKPMGLIVAFWDDSNEYWEYDDTYTEDIVDEDGEEIQP